MKRWMACLLAVMLMLPVGLCEEGYNIAGAVEALKACWYGEYFFAENLPGYLEIKNTRVVRIAEKPKAADESMQPYADEYFGGVDYIVEFMLYSDLLGMAPYYQETGNWDCVVVYKDGSMEVPVNHPFDDYRARTYSTDVSGMIDAVIDFSQEYNAVYYLMEE